MNLPQHFHDRSILQHEPLCTHIALYEQCESRSQSNMVISDFVKAMQKDDQVRCRNAPRVKPYDASPGDFSMQGMGALGVRRDYPSRQIRGRKQRGRALRGLFPLLLQVIPGEPQGG